MRIREGAAHAITIATRRDMLSWYIKPNEPIIPGTSTDHPTCRSFHRPPYLYSALVTLVYSSGYLMQYVDTVP